ncbi:hypothetical protein D9757_000660 [Collybiopsis confluens]|uniref:Formate/nitrite transporter n=1 Tax=Collybiopsis confluens TaxID=2823264 RepID=A0A8H5I125_9AGAR|nr:hypothetical protein D9757_000660 [Collybiopsis confluens]
MEANSPTLKPASVAVSLVESTIAKHNTPYLVIFVKAFLAGVMLSFGGLLSEIVSGGATTLTSSNPGLVKVLGGFVFPVGLVMIVLNGYELLTSNMMYFPMAVLTRAIPWWSLAVNWIIVTFGNLVGSLFFAAILVRYTGVISTAPYNTYVVEFAMKKASDPEWHQIFLRGIGCNWLVSIAVWQAASARDTISKIFAIWIPIWVFVACSYDHGIMFGAELTPAGYIRKSLIASYLGNIVGAQFVGLPAVFFYLRDYNASGLRDAENGQGLIGDDDGHEVTEVRSSESDGSKKSKQQ